MPKLAPPFADAPIAAYLRERIEVMSPKKTQREIAAEVGYDKPNIVSMFKRGDARVPLEKIPLFAKALECDVGHLFRLGLQQYGLLSAMVQEIFGNTVSNNEMEWVREIRKLSNNQDPQMSQVQAQGLAALFKRRA